MAGLRHRPLFPHKQKQRASRSAFTFSLLQRLQGQVCMAWGMGWPRAQVQHSDYVTCLHVLCPRLLTVRGSASPACPRTVA